MAPPHILTREATDAATFHEAVWSGVFNRRRFNNDNNNNDPSSSSASASQTRVPSAVVKATETTHVKEAIDLARSRDCRVAVRSGGHSWAAWSVRRDAVLLDLKGLGRTGEGEGALELELEFEESTGVVKCPPGATGEEVNGFLEGRGRFFAGGHCPDVGLGGFLLQGGMGWNCKNWGWACESMVGIDVVTAEGRELYCSNIENSDLFWAARGAGPGFPAIVTRFHLSTRPLSKMFNTVYIYPRSMYRTVLQWVIDTCPTADPDTEIVCLAKRTADGDNDDDIEIIAGFLSFKPTREAAEAAMAPVRDSHPKGAKVEVFCEPTDLVSQYAGQRAEQPAGSRFCSENAYIIDDGETDVPSVLERAFTTLPTKKSFALYLALNPVARRKLPDMALSLQSDHYFAMYAIWDDAEGKGANEEEDARCTAWVRDIMASVERHSVGSYLGDADFRYRSTRFWAKENGERLREVRRKWDPEGRICGYLDERDQSGVEGLRNEFEWVGK